MVDKHFSVREFSRRLRAHDSGISIVEVLVAALVFTIIAIGIAQAMVNSIRMAGDQRHRITALSLAATEIDFVRSIDDPFGIQSREDGSGRPDPLITVIDGITYRTYRDTEWVSSDGTDIPCGGSGTANLQLKRVNVSVNWTGQLTATQPVSSDTVLAPNGRINDPTLGAIVIATLRDGGAGAQGAQVTVTGVSGGAATPVTQPPVTDAAGCTYALKLKPGVYNVTISKAGYVDKAFTASPVLSVPVTAGTTEKRTVLYDLATTFNLTYAPGSPGGTNFPTNLQSSYLSGGSTVAVLTGTPTSVKAYPGTDYLAFAGKFLGSTQSDGCASLDPSEWDEGWFGLVHLGAGSHGDGIAAPSGSSVNVAERMATVKVKVIAASGGPYFVTAVSSASSIAGSGDPGCNSASSTATRMSYSFGAIATRNVDTRIALPYGSWTLYYGTSAGSTTNQLTTITAESNSALGMVLGNLVTLDPRPAA